MSSPGSQTSTNHQPTPVHIGLLEHVAATALDGDYEAEARRKNGQSVGRPRARTQVGVAAALAVGGFGLLLATAAGQAAAQQSAVEADRMSLVSEVQDRRRELARTRAEVSALQDETAALGTEALDSSQSGRALNDRLAAQALLAGTVPVTGPGLLIVVDDSPPGSPEPQSVFDTDLQLLVNGLWSAGAEAVAINDQRLTTLSAIRIAGEAITVNYRSLARPYRISAIGDPRTLPADFLDSPGGTWWLNLRSLYDMRFEISGSEEMELPAARTVELRQAVVSGRPGPQTAQRSDPQTETGKDTQ